MNQAIDDIRRESWKYSSAKPSRVPPANSPNRPAMALLWKSAQAAMNHIPDLSKFKHFGHEFGIVYLGDMPCVIDLETRRVLVRPPTLPLALS